jgi:hypothetical protein
MDDFDIRNSLHFYTYIEHAESLKLAADENLDLFLEVVENWFTENDRIKTLGLSRSTMLLYSLSIELILKARALFIEKENIKSGQIKTFYDFMKKWKGKSNGHDYLQIVEYYKIKLDSSEIELLKNFQSHAVWAGRFPFPHKESEIIMLEEGLFHRGSLGIQNKFQIQNFINKQVSLMNN